MARLGVLVSGALLTFAVSNEGVAQYYPPPDYPPPDYLPPGYPPRPYYPPPGRPLGYRCDARLPTAYGPAPLICDIVRPRPLGGPCSCPPPRGYPRGEFFGGQVIQ